MTDTINNNFTKMNNSGYLSIYLGCMYAGKTSKLISIYNKNRTAGISTCVINYIEDKRYD
jgi:thymidine kinase